MAKQPKKDMQWEGMLAPLHKVSSDGRMIGDPSPHALKDRPLPVPLLYQDALASGHDGGVPVGLITHAWIDDNNLMGRGTFNDDERGRDMAQRIKRGEHGWVSVTVGNADMSVHAGGEGKPYERADDWELISCTLVSEPAFGTARIRVAPEIGPGDANGGVVQEQPEGTYARTDTEPAPYAVNSPSTGMPVADEGRSWDGPAATKRIETWADGDASKLKRCFLLVDGDPANISSYKLPYADVIDGHPTIVPRAVMAIGSVLSGGRGGVQGGDPGALKSAAAKLYHKIDKQAPWESESENTVEHAAKSKKPVDDVDDVDSGEEDDEDNDSSLRQHAWCCAGFARTSEHDSNCAEYPTGTSKEIDNPGGRAATSSRKHALSASATPLAPPADWFANPQLTAPTPLTVTADGQVYGHLAAFGTCHVGYPNTCVTPPKSKTGYAGFHQGHVVCRDGTSVRVGKIITGTSHASLRQSAQDAFAHYAHTGMAVAHVRAGEDAYGIWVAGALVPDLSDRHIVELRASPLSGDWRDIGGNPELVAALAVNVPGFPIPAARTNEYAETYALVAAGAICRDNGVNALAEQVGEVVYNKLEAARKDEANKKSMDEAMRRVRKQRVDAAVSRAEHAVRSATPPVPDLSPELRRILGKAKKLQNDLESIQVGR